MIVGCRIFFFRWLKTCCIGVGIVCGSSNGPFDNFGGSIPILQMNVVDGLIQDVMERFNKMESYSIICYKVFILKKITAVCSVIFSYVKFLRIEKY